MQTILHMYVVEKRGFGLDAAGLAREFLRVTEGNERWILQRRDLAKLLGLAGWHWELVIGPKGGGPRLPVIQACFPKAISVRYRLDTTLESVWEEGGAAWKESQQIYPV